MKSKNYLLTLLLLSTAFFAQAQQATTALPQLVVSVSNTNHAVVSSTQYQSLRYPKPVTQGVVLLEQQGLQVLSFDPKFRFEDESITQNANRFAPNISVARPLQAGVLVTINDRQQIVINNNPSITNFQDTLLIKMIHPSLPKPLIVPIPLQSGSVLPPNGDDIPAEYDQVTTKSGAASNDFLTINAHFQPNGEQTEVVLQKYGNRYLVKQNQFPRLTVGKAYDLMYDFDFKDGQDQDWKLLSRPELTEQYVPLDAATTQQLDTVWFAFRNTRTGGLLQAGVTCLWLAPENAYVPRNAQISSNAEDFLVVITDMNTKASIFEGSLAEANKTIIDVRQHTYLAVQVVPDEKTLNKLVEKRASLSVDMEWANRDLDWESKQKWNQVIDLSKQPEVDQIEYLKINLKENGVNRTTPVLFRVQS